MRSSVDGALSGNFSSRSSIRNQQKYLGLLDDDEEVRAPLIGSSSKQPGFFDRFRDRFRSSKPAAPSRRDSVLLRVASMHCCFCAAAVLSLLQLISFAGGSYVSPFEPVLNEGDRFASFLEV